MGVVAGRRDFRPYPRRSRSRATGSSAIVDLAFTYPEFAVAVKRGHDRNMPLWLLGAFFGASALLDLLTVLEWAGTDEEPSMLSLLIALPFTVLGLALLVELGFRKGTTGSEPVRARPAEQELTSREIEATVLQTEFYRPGREQR